MARWLRRSILERAVQKKGAFMKLPVRSAILLSLLVFAGCAYRQTQPGYGGTAAYDSQVISSPAYTGAATSPGTSVTAPPVYSANSPAAQASAVPNETPSVAADRDLVNRVQQALRGSSLNGLAPNINVSALNGDVTLTGYVPNERDRQAVETLARNTTGVLNVDNEIRVVGPAGNQALYPATTVNPTATYPPSPTGTAVAGDIFNLHVQGLNDADRTLAQRILQGLRTDNALASLFPSVNIDVSGGRVILQGQVQSEQQRQTIESVVRQAAGINNVEDQLQVNAGPVFSNP